MKVLKRLLYIELLVLFIYPFHAKGREIISDPNLLQETFEKEYIAWKEHCNKASASSTINDRIESQHFKNIVAMGPDVLPLLVEKTKQEPNFQWSGWAWVYITHVIPDPSINPWAKESVDDWWNGGKKQTRQRFEAMYKDWKEYKTKNMTEDADKKYKGIKSLGIAALPEMIEKIKEGDTELIKAVSQLTENKVKINATASECLEWWQQNKEDWLIPFPNKQPKANAGQNKTVTPGQNVQLDASASSDDDQDTLNYQWKKISGPEVKLSDTNNVKLSFTAPTVDKETELVFELIVSDGSRTKQVHPSCESGQSKPSTVKITIKP